jgi:hypothetical protein
VWWTNLRGKGTRNSLNGAPYGSSNPGRREPAVGARTEGRGGLVGELCGAVPDLGGGLDGPGSG